MKRAFTLAEVLITLGVIGVIAAMTLPMLVHYYKEQETVAKVKKFYSIFSQAYSRAILDTDDEGNSVYSEDALKQSDKFISILKPYLKSVKNQGIKNQSKDASLGFVLADGVAIVGVYLEPSNCVNDKSYCGDFYITTNGKPLYSNKKTKTVSKYGFAFYIRKNRIEPVGGSNSVFKEQCVTGKNNSRCTAWIIMNGNMDYLHCSDLDFNGKTKCK